MSESLILTHAKQGHFYRLGERLLPGVTTVLAATRPAETREALASWSERVGVEAAESIRQDSSARGNRLHTLLQQYLTGEAIAPEVTAAAEPWWQSVQIALAQIGEVHLIEAPVYHPVGWYAGTVDLVCRFQQELVILDWKTAEWPKPRAWLGDYPLQLAAYAGAVNRLYDLRIASGIIVLAHRRGPARIYRYDPEQLRQCWNSWLRRLRQFWVASCAPEAAEIVASLDQTYRQMGGAPTGPTATN